MFVLQSSTVLFARIWQRLCFRMAGPVVQSYMENTYS